MSVEETRVAAQAVEVTVAAQVVEARVRAVVTPAGVVAAVEEARVAAAAATQAVAAQVEETRVRAVVSGAPGPAGPGVPRGGETGQALVKASDADYDTEWSDAAGGGAVDSVNGQTGIVVLDAADVGAETAGAVAAHSADTTGVHGIADTAALVLTGDARLGDARTPTAHKASHATGGSDALAPADIGAAAAADLTAHTGRTDNPHGVTAAQTGAEPAMGDPTHDDYALYSTAAGVRYWAAPSGGMSNPMTSPGDLIVGGAGGAPTRLAAATNGYVLTLVDGVPAWVAVTPAWSSITGKPTTLSGYGITDVLKSGAGALTLSAAAAYTLTVPATGTAALLGTSNLFSARQDIRASGSGVAAGLYVPWISGDAAPTAVFGSSNSANNKNAIKCYGYAEDALSVSSVAGTCISAISGAANPPSTAMYLSSSGALAMYMEMNYNSGLTITREMFRMIRAVAGVTPGDGFGFYTAWRLNSSTTYAAEAARSYVSWSSATNATRTARRRETVYDYNGEREFLRGEATGSAAAIGVLGAAAIPRQTITGSRSDGTALAALLTAMAAFGYIVDSTTA